MFIPEKFFYADRDGAKMLANAFGYKYEVGNRYYREAACKSEFAARIDEVANGYVLTVYNLLMYGKVIP